jgi:predicted dehydrogenase
MKAAITGTGFMGGTHTEGLRRAGVDVIGILGSSPQKSSAAAARFQIPKAYGTLDELLADPEVDAVHITTPNRFHFESAKRAIAANKHVLCEKPLAMNTTESAELVALAEQANVAAGVNYNIRFYPLCLEAREMVSRGDIGKIHSLTGGYVQDWLLYDTDYNWRVLASEGGALRAIADIGTHWLDLVQSITGEKVTSVLADLHTIHPQRKKPLGEVETFSGKMAQDNTVESIAIDTEDMGSILLRFQSGAKGNLFVSQVTAGRKNCLRFELAGARKTLAWNSESPNEIEIGHRNQPNEKLTKDPGLLSEPSRGFADYPGGHNEGYPDTFKMCFRAFYDYIACGDLKAPRPFPTFEEGHREIQLCEAILESHRKEQWIGL